ncbi:MAG: TlpA family protein disulfide reductase [Burkholderiales bacterium]|nr:TlpA family protein disulfide reductase [Burkholderiales bacterium]
MPEPQVRSRRRWVVMAGAGAVAALAGYGVNRWLREPPDAGAGNPAALQALLAARMPSLDGGTRALEHWRGQVLVVNFWATWCAPCRKEIPEFVRVQARHGGRGLQLVGIAIDQPQAVRAFASEFGINYPLLIGGLDTMALMREAGNRASVLPFTMVLDRRGNVAKRHAGTLDEAQVERIIKPLL